MATLRTQPERVPTVDDLRVKLCYICREEELHDKPAEPPVAWVHPCNCTLVAHEACLLNWIKSAQSDPSRKGNALKCPQCAAAYEITSIRPWGLRLLDHLNASLSVAGKVITASSVTAIMLACGAGFYVVLTSYGMYAVQEFIGQEMYEALLTDDPTNWPWHAFINLPLIPLTLLASRTRFFNGVPLFPLFLAWTSSPPAFTGAQGSFRLTTSNLAAYPMQPLIRWPPSPIMVTILFPFIRSLYDRGMTVVRQWVLGPQHGADQGPVRRLEWALLGGNGPAQLRVEIDENREGDEPRRRQNRQNRRERRGAAGARRNGNGDRNRDNDNDDEADDELDDAAVADQTIRVNGGSIGRFIGGALLLPTVSKWMGTMLFHLSKRSSWLRTFLAIHPHMYVKRDYGRAWFQEASKPAGLSQLGMSLRVAFNMICGGTKIWAEADPVWWRNTVGMGIFIFARDCLNLWHIYLTKREIESRHVKSRSFAGVDIKELDLIRPQQEQVAGPSSSAPVNGALSTVIPSTSASTTSTDVPSDTNIAQT